jgi:SAM-dependent methyltransferase
MTRPCPICRLPQENTVSAGDGAEAGCPRAVVCPGCGVVAISPIPPSAVDPGHYDGDYYRPWQKKRHRARARLWRRRVAAILARTDPGTLLDVGCGDGQFLSAARAAGFTVDGIEFSPEGARRSAAAIGRPVAIGDLATARGLAGPFQTITLWHVLEHVADPSRLLAAVRARLAPGGLLAVAVPNLENLPLRAIYRLVRRRPLPLFEPGAREPHLTHFSPSTLAASLERHGFGAIEVVRDRCALDLPKRLIDAAAALLSRLSGRLLVDAIVAYARNPR